MESRWPKNSCKPNKMKQRHPRETLLKEVSEGISLLVSYMETVYKFQVEFWALTKIFSLLNQWDILWRNLIMTWQWQLCWTAANFIVRFLTVQISSVHDLHFYAPGRYINDIFLCSHVSSRHNTSKTLSSLLFTS